MNMPSVPIKPIRENYLCVKDRISVVAKEAGRDPDAIQLVVVTKTHPIEVVQAVIDAGATDIGENYVEEAIPKIQSMGNHRGVRWHMIGHVQSRKALPVCEYFHYVHSLDSMKLAERLSRFAVELDKKIPGFLEFNLSGETTKSGWYIGLEGNLSNFLPDFEKIISLPGLNILGLMTIPPYSTDPEVSRPYYRRLKVIQEQLIQRFQLSGFRGLSIGMSGDFEVAIQEGSTCVRIGTAIIGPRIT